MSSKAGMSWPMELAPTGGIRMNTQQARKKRLLVAAILTEVGSRIDDPTLGIMGDAYLFRSSMPTVLESVLKYKLSEQLSRDFNIEIDRFNITSYTDSQGATHSVCELTYTDRDTRTHEALGIQLPE